MNNSSQPVPGPGKKKNKIDLGFIRIPRSILPIVEKVFLLFIVALAIYYFFPKISSFEETLYIFSSLNFWAVFLAIAAQILRTWYGGYTL
jgi:predicted membrane protein